MKVEIISSWCHPTKGKTYPNGTELEIDKKYFSKDFHKEIKPKKTTKKDK